MLITPFANFTPSAFDIIITCADGLENALLIELASFGLVGNVVRTGRVRVLVCLAQFYKICLYSRVASRILLPLGEYYFRQKTQSINQVREVNGKKTTRTIDTTVIDEDIPSALYEFASRYDWTMIFGVEHTFAIRLSVDKRLAVNQQFATLRVKDAIADCFNKKLGKRPNVDKSPDFYIYVHAANELAELYLDLSGTSLHRRGYRVANTNAPLKENLAAALLYECHWHDGNHTGLIDPMCGSGTLLTEGLLMKVNYPVGIDKKASDFGFYHWQHHDDVLWQTLANDALNELHDNLARLEQQLISGDFVAIALDADAKAVQACQKNLLASALASVVRYIHLEQRPLAKIKSMLTSLNNTYPLIITNPPYGERLGELDFIKPLYHGLGLLVADSLRDNECCKKADMAVLCSHIEHADTLPIANPKTLKCHNGALNVYFRYGTIDFKKNNRWANNLIINFTKKQIDNPDSQEFINRLQKNITNLRKYAQKNHISNMRVYDADLPNFNVAIDVYGDKIHIQEYAPPKQIPSDIAKARFNLVLSAVRDIFAIDREHIFIKTRMRQSGNEQYGKNDSQKPKKMTVIDEHEAYFYVNFTDYLDTGLFIDHRNIRAMIKKDSCGKNVLNLFAYTCTASVHSAMGGAKSVTSVDLSANYLNWGKKNFALNGLDLTAVMPDDTLKYQFIATDVFMWLKSNTERFDLIFIDPPTFSNSKKFKGTFDVQRDHVALISRAMNRLNANGVLYFSNNFTKFVLDDEIKRRYDVVEITDKTIGVDFNTKKPIHQSFKITHKNHIAQVYDVASDFDVPRGPTAVSSPKLKSYPKDGKANFKIKSQSKHHSNKNGKKSFDKAHQDGVQKRKKDGINHWLKSTNQADVAAIKSDKPKVHYQKIDGKWVAKAIDDTCQTTKKYTIKSND